MAIPGTTLIWNNKNIFQLTGIKSAEVFGEIEIRGRVTRRNKRGIESIMRDFLNKKSRLVKINFPYFNVYWEFTACVTRFDTTLTPLILQFSLVGEPKLITTD